VGVPNQQRATSTNEINVDHQYGVRVQTSGRPIGIQGGEVSAIQMSIAWSSDYHEGRPLVKSELEEKITKYFSIKIFFDKNVEPKKYVSTSPRKRNF